MHPWFVTYTTGPLDVRKTFEGFGFTLADFQYLENPKL